MEKNTTPHQPHTLAHGKASIMVFAEDEKHARLVLDEALSQTNELDAQTKQQARAWVEEGAVRLLWRLTGEVSGAERETWPIKAGAASAYLAGTASAAQTAMLSAEAVSTQEKIEDLCQKILDKHNAYLLSIGQCAGLRRKMLAEVEKGKSASATRAALKSFEEEARILVNKGKKQNA